MSPVFAARRRAEEFDALVQRGPEQPLGPEEARYAELLELAGALRAVPAPEPRPEFAAALRERLMEAAASELTPAERPERASVEDRLTLSPRRTSRQRRIAIAVSGFAVVGASTSMAVAAQSALPGDALYPVKRAIENAHIGVSVGDQQKGSTLLGNARARLREATELAAESPERQDTGAIRDTLDDFGSQADEATTLLLEASDGDRAAVENLQTFTGESLASLEEVSDRVSDDEVRDALVEAGNVLLGIELKLQQACPDCPDPLTQIPQWLITQASAPLGSTAPSTPEESPSTEEREPRGATGQQGGRGPRGEGDGTEFSPVLPTEVPSGLPGAGGPPPGAGTGDGTGEGGSGDGSAKGPKKGPVGNLIEGITGGEDNPIPVVPELLAGVGALLDGLTAPLLGGLTGGNQDKQ